MRCGELTGYDEAPQGKKNGDEDRFKALEGAEQAKTSCGRCGEAYCDAVPARRDRYH